MSVKWRCTVSKEDVEPVHLDLFKKDVVDDRFLNRLDIPLPDLLDVRRDDLLEIVSIVGRQGGLEFRANLGEDALQGLHGKLVYVLVLDH